MEFQLRKGIGELYLARACDYNLGISKVSGHILTLLVLERC